MKCGGIRGRLGVDELEAKGGNAVPIENWFLSPGAQNLGVLFLTLSRLVAFQEQRLHDSELEVKKPHKALPLARRLSEMDRYINTVILEPVFDILFQVTDGLFGLDRGLVVLESIPVKRPGYNGPLKMP